MDNQSPSQPLVVAFGELMLRLACEDGRRFRDSPAFRRIFGGAEANVCVLLSQLGHRTRFVSALPANDLGQAALESLQQYGVDTSCVLRSGQRIGIYFTEDGNGIRPGRVIYDRKGASFSTLEPGQLDWDRALDGARFFYWTGISPALTASAAARCREALDAARARNLTIAVDMNYRSTLWDYGTPPAAVMPDLLGSATVVTGDVDTLGVYFGIQADRHLTPEDQFRHCAEELSRRLPAMKVFAMSFRGWNPQQQSIYRGALLAEGNLHYSPVYSLPRVVDRIGSGDAFQAGLLDAVLRGRPAGETIHFATACGVLKHSMAGDFTLLSRAEIEQFMQHGPTSHVIR
ncbi:MAG TPA: sugar kinase [Chitinophagaceae bacterium]|nr:sugar kinase [Chitinophagaceae bacterium]